MERQWVVVEIDHETRLVRRQGRLVNRRPPHAEVCWPDGENELIRPGRHGETMLILAQEGSMNHRLLVERDLLEKMAREEPHRVFALMLEDATRPMTGQELGKRLRSWFPDADLGPAWKRAKADLDADPRVQKIGEGAKAAYRWSGPASQPPAWPEDLTAKEAAPAAGSSDISTGNGALTNDLSSADTDRSHTDRPLRAEQKSLAARPAMSVVSPAIGSGVELRLVLAELAQGKALTVRSEEVREALDVAHPAVRLLHAALVPGALSPEVWRETAVSARQSPLAAGVALGQLTEPTLAAALPRMMDAAWCLVGIPRASKSADSVDVVDLLDPDEVGALLDSARRELAMVAQQGKADDHAAAFERMVRRVLDKDSARQLKPSAILSSTASLHEGDASSIRDWAAAVLSRCLEAGRQALWQRLSVGERADIARHLERAPLRRESGRARALTALLRIDPANLASVDWWRGVTLDDLMDIANSPLGNVLESVEVRSEVVRPLAESALRETVTRQRLMQIMGAPSPVAKALDSRTVAEAARRVLRKDAVGAQWLEELSSEGVVAELRAESAELRRKVTTAQEEAASARSIMDDLERRLERTEERLQQARARSQDLRESQVRQIRLDALRSLAEVVVYVDGALDRQSSERISQRLAAMTKREGLVRLGERGQSVPYQPLQHELLGADIPPGSPVIVTAVGYAVRGDGDTPIVLVRSMVERDGD